MGGSSNRRRLPTKLGVEEETTNETQFNLRIEVESLANRLGTVYSNIDFLETKLEELEKRYPEFVSLNKMARSLGVTREWLTEQVDSGKIHYVQADEVKLLSTKEVNEAMKRLLDA